MSINSVRRRVAHLGLIIITKIPGNPSIMLG